MNKMKLMLENVQLSLKTNNKSNKSKTIKEPREFCGTD